MKRIYYIFYVLLLASLYGCEDRLTYPGEIPDGVSDARFQLSFNDFTPSLENSRSSGTAIKSIDKLWVVIYTTDGTLYEYKQIGDYKLTPNSRPDGSESSEVETGHAEFTMRLPNGRYRIYAVANCDLTAEDVISETALQNKKLIWQNKKLAGTKGQPNSEMFGYFTNSEKGDMESTKGFQAGEVIVNGSLPLHAWIKRAASKLTVAFDTHNLKDNVYIYIQSIKIKDIPTENYLGRRNQPGEKDRTISDELVDGETLYLANASATDVAKADYGKWRMLALGNRVWGMNSEAGNNMPESASIEDCIKNEHLESVEALYFYENSQPEGTEGTESDKRQDVHGENKQVTYPDGVKPDNPAWKDARPYGSYVEVKGYYICEDNVRPGKGEILYRFMLGKNTTTDYDAERNHHYQLTMHFNGYANDVDFHIDYREESKPGPYSPDTTYVSYSYNQPAHTVFRGTPRQGYKMTSLDVYILKNEWRPHSNDGTELAEPAYNNKAWDMQIKGDGNYAGGSAWKVSDNHDEEDPNCEFGFLSLRYTKDVDIDMGGKTHFNNNLADRVKRFRLSYTRNISEGAGKPLNLSGNGPGKYPKGRRTYKIDNVLTYGTPTPVPVAAEIDADETDDGNAQVSYDIVPKGDPNTTADDEHNYIFTIPLYTRAKSLDPWCVYSGANAYYQHYRYAKIKFVAHYEKVGDPSDKYTDVSYTNVLQARRIDNPRGIIREGSNTDPFKVRLLYSTIDANNHVNGFKSVVSRGPWTATIENDPHGLVQLTGNGQTATGEGSYITGRTNTEISFTYTPLHTVDNSMAEGAVIRVTYHNNSCVHNIIVRQGHGPAQLVAGGMNWSAYNIFDKTHLTVNPLSSGSLFRRYWTIEDPISTDNNRDYGFGTVPEYGVRFKLSPLTSNQTKRWNSNILYNADGVSGTYNQPASYIPYMPWGTSEGDAFGTFTMNNGVQYMAPDGKRYADLIGNKGVDFAFGIVYGNGATETLSTTDAFAFTDPNNNITSSKYGARGVIAYNSNKGSSESANNIFFPFGKYGHARRKAREWYLNGTSLGTRKGNGILRYGSLDVRLGGFLGQQRDYNDYRPMAYNLPDQEGGIYWFGKPDGSNIAADFNYGNYMTSVLGQDNLYTQSEYTENRFYYVGPGHGNYNYQSGSKTFTNVGANKGSYRWGNPASCDAVCIKPVRR